MCVDDAKIEDNALVAIFSGLDREEYAEKAADADEADADEADEDEADEDEADADEADEAEAAP